jgi:oxygen-dependent protoporphyrinogen oxidase
VSNPSKHVVIVGGGIAGLTTAYTVLTRAASDGLPLTCTVLESDRYWGGKIRTHRSDGFVIEAGPDSFLSTKPWALTLCRELGLGDHVVNTNASEEKAFVYSRGRLRPLPEGLVLVVPTKLGPFLRSGLLSVPGTIRMGLDLFIKSRSPDGDESLGSFFRRRLGKEAFERLVEPLMAGIYAGDADRMSLRATFPRFLELEKTHGGLIKGVLAARRASSGSRAQPAKGTTAFVTLQGGLSTMIDALRDRIERSCGQLQPARRVVSIRPPLRTPGGAYQVLTEEGPSLTADAVVLATPAFVTGELVRPLSWDAAALLSAVPYASTATVSLGYDTDRLAPAVKGFGFVVPRAEGRQILAATWSSLKWPQRAPAARTLVRCYLGGMGREDIVKADDETMIRRVTEELSALAGITRAPLFAEVHRWERGMPQYEIGHLQRVDHIQSLLKPFGGLYLTGAAYRGIGIPDCIRDGTETGHQALRYLFDRPL